MTRSLAASMQDKDFAGYAYAYPHKTSYRPLAPSIRLSQAWQAEEKDALFLYVHLPFCEMRCGFCNLFTTVRPHEDFVSQTLSAIERQSVVVAKEIQPERISRVAFGGGTPSFLTASELESLFNRLEATWPFDWRSVRTSFEVSPATVTKEKLAVLKAHHCERISMGVQSFSSAELKRLGRPQSNEAVEEAITDIQACDFPIFNLDLMYGVEGQTEQTWLQTLQRAIDIAPDEIYMYPLYVRELTGLGRTGKSPSDQRRTLYLAARDALRTAGYQQQSMRLFRRPSVSSVSETLDYCCQDDGMIGLGPGARSYTRTLHYSSEYAVRQQEVKSIIADFNARGNDEFALADYGAWLDGEEQRRRYLIKSVLRREGLVYPAYQQRFGTELEDDFPQLTELKELDLAECDGNALRLTDEGLSWSDVIGPWLYSAQVVSRMEAFDLV